MVNIPVTKLLIFETRQLAGLIEEEARAYLPPYPAGIYSPTCVKPLLIPGQLYYCRAENNSNTLVPVVIKTAADVTGDIFNADAKLLVAGGIRRLLSDAPQFPIHGCSMIKELVDCILEEESEFASPKRSCTKIEDLWPDRFIMQDPALLDLKIRLHEQLTSISRMVREFVGKDKWVLHYAEVLGGDLAVRKTIDYRIWDWQRRMASGEWK